LEDERNVFAAEKQFILANEVTGSDKRTMVGRLRNLITQHTVVINKKYQPDYVIRDTINYFFTSNHIDAVYMEDDERRFFVHEVLGPRLVDVDREKVEAYDAWLRSGECSKALFYYLLNVDLTGFDHTAPAPDTRSKAAMVAASRSEIENWCYKLKEDPDTCLRSGETIIPFSLFRSKDLIDVYASINDGKRPYEKTIANALRKAGFMKAAKDQSCPTKDGKINLWAVRERGDHELSAQAAGKKYDAERAFETKSKKFTRQ
jgi:tmRNA-binding protein